METLKILSIILGSLAPIVLYHRMFVHPHIVQMLDRELHYKVLANQALKQLVQYQEELKINQKIIKNLTGDARTIARKDILPSFVYFIANRGQGTVKIGFSNDPEKRLIQLQTSNHEQLEILAIIEADEKTEGILHDRFKAYRLNGEWFKLSPEILRFIEDLEPVVK